MEPADGGLVMDGPESVVMLVLLKLEGLSVVSASAAPVIEGLESFVPTLPLEVGE